MFCELYLIFLFKLDVVLDEVVGSILWLFTALFILSAKFHLVEQSHLDDFVIVDHFLFLGKVYFLEIGPIFVSARYIRSNLVEIGSRNESLDLIEQSLYLHVSRKFRISDD